MPNSAPIHRPTFAQAGGRKDADDAYRRTRMMSGVGRLIARYRNSRRWRKLRAHILIRRPKCEACVGKGLRTVAADVHHVVPAQQDPTLFFVESNLKAVCRRCHNALDAHLRGQV